MIQKWLYSVLFVLSCSLVQAQLKSPEEFLGYRVGDKFTPHWKVVNYFQHVAANASDRMKLTQYGETNEGRPLLVAVVSSVSNISNLESIRMNNIRLANMSRDMAAPSEENAHAIVWLSYNVHGNEASSTEAAMLCLYALIDPVNAKTREWLMNTVVVIDPCLNPDGRDRYVNWYNSVAGKKFNPLLISREHNEPWPFGRSNHYNFDLNRDWAWQTQQESRQHVKVYHEWMPQVHVDFHEQGINNPYYFAPAAEPFHEVITPWQREFQLTIGKNHAKYFDANGWLYFTREEFDLFYPSYGDTWPIFNGSIGMTYEQAGHSMAGLGVINADGDTLTLYDRALHHYTTSLSTIEVASQNKARLIKEFRKFFNEAVSTGIGEYKTYVIKFEDREKERLEALTALLDKNMIQYSGGTGSGKGYNYNSGKEETFSIGPNDIVISAMQPKSALVKVLMEPRSKLVDSVTYDITAWSLPYVYGINAYASRDKISLTAQRAIAARIANPGTSYGYVIPWMGVKTVKLVSALLKKGILLRYSEEPFEAGGNKFGRGSVIVLSTSNRSFGNNLWSITRQAADENDVQIFPVSSGFVDKGFDFGSGKVERLKAPRVALITGEGIASSSAGGIWHFFEQEIQYPITLVNQNNWSMLNLSDFDVVIMPEGNYRFLSDKVQADAFKSWISKGGKVVALEGAISALAKAEFGMKIKKAEETDKKDEKPGYEFLRKFEDRERDFIPGTIPGSIYRVELDNSHPLAYGYPDYYYTLKQDDNIYEFIKENGWNVGVIRKDNQVAGFVGYKLKERLKDGTLFGVLQMGAGSISFLSDNVIFRGFWENGKLMLCNAVFLVGGQ